MCGWKSIGKSWKYPGWGWVIPENSHKNDVCSWDLGERLEFLSVVPGKILSDKRGRSHQNSDFWDRISTIPVFSPLVFFWDKIPTFPAFFPSNFLGQNFHISGFFFFFFSLRFFGTEFPHFLLFSLQFFWDRIPTIPAFFPSGSRLWAGTCGLSSGVGSKSIKIFLGLTSTGIPEVFLWFPGWSGWIFLGSWFWLDLFLWKNGRAEPLEWDQFFHLDELENSVFVPKSFP